MTLYTRCSDDERLGRAKKNWKILRGIIIDDSMERRARRTIVSFFFCKLPNRIERENRANLLIQIDDLICQVEKRILINSLERDILALVCEYVDMLWREFQDRIVSSFQI